VCFGFEERMIVGTPYTIGANDSKCSHIKSWLVDTSADGDTWREIACEENNERLNDIYFTDTFAVAGGGEFRFIRLATIGRSRSGHDCLCISAWEIVRILIE
jgi:hypothetical protein